MSVWVARARAVAILLRKRMNGLRREGMALVDACG